MSDMELIEARERLHERGLMADDWPDEAVAEVARLEGEVACMFSSEFRERLRHGKYTSWAVDLTADDLEALLWMAAEFGYRADRILEVTAPYSEGGLGRAWVGLETICRMVLGEHLNRDEAIRRIRTSSLRLAEWRESYRETGFGWPVISTADRQLPSDK